MVAVGLDWTSIPVTVISLPTCIRQADRDDHQDEPRSAREGDLFYIGRRAA